MHVHGLVTINFKGNTVSLDGVRVTVGVGGVLKIAGLGESGMSVLLIPLFMELLDILIGELLENCLDSF